MSYQIRVILDTKEDVFKDVLVDENITLLDFHTFIKNSFTLLGNELASFYTASESWEQNEDEIPLENLTDDENVLTMKDVTLKQVLPAQNDKLIYVYDLFCLWTFFVELIKIEDQKTDETAKVLFSFGEMPETAPEKIMDGLNLNNSNLDEDEDDFFEQEDSDYDQQDLDGFSEFDSDDRY